MRACCSRSGLRPDCEMARYNASVMCGRAAYTELTDGAAETVMSPSCVSNTYFAYVAA